MIRGKPRDAAPATVDKEVKERRPPPHKDRGAPPGTSWIYGRHAVAAALANPTRRLRRVVATRDTEAELAPLLVAARADLPPRAEILERATLAQLLPEDAVHQGMAVAADPLPRAELRDLVASLPEAGAPHVVVVLDQVSDPHNVGAVLRSAAAFAALAVVMQEHGAPPATGVLAKAASGALETVPLVRAPNLVRALDQLKEAGFWCVGLAEDATQDLAALDLPPRIALVLGAEGGGMRRLTRERCDFVTRLPTRGALRSLNVSNAAAVALYEVTRRKDG
jgi:23S rRNA (guanosine2251-2'-O)-methyltransferase